MFGVERVSGAPIRRSKKSAAVIGDSEPHARHPHAMRTVSPAMVWARYGARRTPTPTLLSSDLARPRTAAHLHRPLEPQACHAVLRPWDAGSCRVASPYVVPPEFMVAHHYGYCGGTQRDGQSQLFAQRRSVAR
jgi:hypothetical protein